MQIARWARATALIAATTMTQPLSALVITEIHYYPSGNDDPAETLEFIEIRNNTSHAADLSGYHFASGVRFAFPENFLLAGWEHIVVCADVDRFRQQYGIENAIGNFEGRLNNSGERLQLANRAGSIVSEVDYDDKDPWPTEADGTGYTIVALQSLLDVGDPSNWTFSGQPGGTPGIENFPPPQERRELVFPGTGPESVWSFRPGWNSLTEEVEEFSEPVSAWFAEDFDDSLWATGETPIGIGEDEIVTLLPDAPGKYKSFAARKRFTITQEQHDRAESFLMEIGMDDGAVFYLNGQEAARLSIDGEPGTHVPVDTAARLTTELRRTVEVPLPKELVRVGENLLAVQVHNRSLSSRDLGIVVDFQIRFHEFFAGPPEPALVINEVVTRSSEGRSVELHNSRPTVIDLTGYELAPTPSREAIFKIPDGTLLAGGGFVSFTEEEIGFPLLGEDLKLYLYEGDGQSIVDAISISDPTVATDPILSHARFPDGSDHWRLSTEATPNTANRVPLEDGLVINEIHYAPRDLGPDGKPLAEGEATEFLEVFNRSDRTISLDGLAFKGGYNYEFEPGQSLGAGEYLVIAPHPETIVATYGLAPSDVVGLPPGASVDALDSFGRLRNSGECVRLVDRLGNPIDEVCYRDGGEWDELADGGGSTLELIDAAQDNAVGPAWEASDEAGQSEWTEFTYERNYPGDIGPGIDEPEIHLFLLSSGECLIDGLSVESILPEGAVNAPPPERVANGDFEEDTRPWRLWGNHIHSVQTTEDSQIGNGSLHLIATGPGNNKANRLEIDALDTIRTGPVKVRFWAKWLRGSNALHISGHNNAFGRTVFLPVPTAVGTPGAENRATARLRELTGTANQGPVLSSPAHAPAVPSSTDEIQFRICASDSDGVASVNVLYRTETGMEPQRAVLVDTGPLEAGRLDDTFYAVNVPPEPENGEVDFWFEAKDKLGNVSTYPREGPDAPLTLVVDDPLESQSAARFRVIMGRQSLRSLATRLLHSNDSLPGTFVLEEREIFYNVGYRYHGSPWGRPSNPKSFRVNFKSDRPFMGGAKRLNISGRVRAQSEPTAYHFLERASTVNAVVPYSPQFQFLRVKVNDRIHSTSPMVEIRAIDSTYASFHWPNDANGVVTKISGKLAFNDQGERGPAPFWTEFRVYDSGVYEGNVAENYRFFYNPKTRRDEDPFEDLMRFLGVLDERTTPDPEQYLAEIENVMNVESFLRDFIVRLLHDDWDTIDIGNGQNAYLYYAPNEGRHYLVPWDMDNTFGNSGSRLTPTSTTFGLGRLISFPKYRRLYGRIMKELITTFWNPEHLQEWLTVVNRDAPFNEVPLGNSVVSFVRGRVSRVESFLGTALTAEFSILTPDPFGVPGTTGVV